jgi:hypothetical protein
MPKHDILEDPAGEGDAGNGGSVRSVKLIGAPTQRRRRSAFYRRADFRCLNLHSRALSFL